MSGEDRYHSVILQVYRALNYSQVMRGGLYDWGDIQVFTRRKTFAFSLPYIRQGILTFLHSDIFPTSD